MEKLQKVLSTLAAISVAIFIVDAALYLISRQRELDVIGTASLTAMFGLGSAVTITILIGVIKNTNISPVAKTVQVTTLIIVTAACIALTIAGLKCLFF